MTDRTASREEAIRTAERLFRLHKDPAIQAWFAGEDVRLVDAMLINAGTDTPALVLLLQELAALRALRRFLSDSVARGERAANKLIQEQSDAR